uniref:Uncharacterized protein n=1 Tax=Ditylenchus dipsaci TaxID=166011 RepID=A0A915DRD8_9BILA
MYIPNVEEVAARIAVIEADVAHPPVIRAPTPFQLWASSEVKSLDRPSAQEERRVTKQREANPNPRGIVHREHLQKPLYHQLREDLECEEGLDDDFEWLWIYSLTIKF